MLLCAVEDLLEMRDPVRKAERAAKRQQVKEVKALGTLAQKEDEKDSATSAKKGFDIGGELGPTITLFSLKKNAQDNATHPAEKGRSPSSQKEIGLPKGRRLSSKEASNLSQLLA